VALPVALVRPQPQPAAINNFITHCAGPFNSPIIWRALSTLNTIGTCIGRDALNCRL
jgi:hypothetical protein